VMYILGRGVVQSDRTAFSWFMKAANQGHATAKIWLGVMYRDGQGVAKNYVEAYKWFSLAKGNKTAEKALNTVKKSMTPAQVKEAKEKVALFKDQSR